MLCITWKFPVVLDALLKATTSVCVSAIFLPGKQHPIVSGVAVPEEREKNSEGNVSFY